MKEGNIKILTIGEEILRGEVVDTNFLFLTKLLLNEGWVCQGQETLQDDPEKIKKAIIRALEEHDILILTGGLGPTCDDYTKRVLSEMFNKKLVSSISLKKNLSERYGENLLSLEEQSTVPEGVTLLPNRIGTAPGFMFEEKGKKIFALPGVCIEMQEMAKLAVLPLLKKILPASSYVSKEYGCCLLNENQIDQVLREIKKKYPTIQLGIYPGMGIVRIKMSVDSLSKKEQFEKACLLFEKEFETFIFTDAGKSLSHAIQDLFLRKKMTLSVAESCTGGEISAKLVETAGASAYFLGSVVAYSNFFKKVFLGVSEEELITQGAVSKEIVEKMLKGILEHSNSDVAIAVSGVAGPSGGSLEKPVGTVWCGIAFREGPSYVWKILAKGGSKRDLVINYTTHFILGSLYRLLEYQINPLTPG